MAADKIMIEAVIDWPDLSPDDYELLEEISELSPWMEPEMARRLEDLRMRMARMLLTATVR